MPPYKGDRETATVNQRGGGEKKTLLVASSMREEGGGKNTDAQEVTPPPLCIVYGRASKGHGKMLCVLRGI